VTNPTSEHHTNFSIRGISLEFPNSLLGSDIRQALDGGHYEMLEFDLIGQIVCPNDVVLEIGAAVGFVSAGIARRIADGRLVAVEANPELIAVAERTFELNNVKVDLRNAMVVGRTGSQPASKFTITPSFWTSSNLAENGRTISVREVTLRSLVEEVQPTVLVTDIEGSEQSLFDDVDLSGVRCAMVEVHKNVIGIQGVRTVFDRLAEHGLFYDPDISAYHVVTFSRS